ncbi:MDR family MFS transporter [Streptomyces sp. NBC_01618]|uniref:MDR family MFS transporter n=1 Tax=Streptomyces sp. NBC_01618 TaxID=2975900 RepID=UPI003864CA26|nr:MDR family MFS transporter [Streptomyces sp. NBC_01618]
MDQLITEDPTHIGPYRLIARLGAGGMGLVYLGRSETGRTVAVKVVQAEHAQHPEFRKRFAREVAAARRVGGTWTAAVLDADTEAPVPWVATQYIPGPDLTTVVAKDFGPLPEHSVRTLANRLAVALQSVHAAGLIHRDLKPSNVLVTVDGPRVIDFGIARAMDSLAEDSLHTRTGMLIGSPGFMSPEQVRGLELTPASDVFCLGAVLVYAATGRLLFGATETGLNAHLFRIAEEEADLTGVPESLVDLVRECLHKDPAQRPTPADVAARTATDQDGEWLPGSVLAQLGRHAAQLLDFAPEVRVTQSDPRIPAQAQRPAQPQPLPPPPAYTPTTPADHRPAPPAFAPSAGPVPGGPPIPPAPGDARIPRRWWGLTVAALAQLLVLIGTTSLNLALPSISADLNLSTGDGSSLITAFGLAFGISLLLGGHITDLLGRKRTLIIGSAGYAVACAIGGSAPSLGVLIGARVLQGASAALISSAVLALVSAGFTDPKARGRAFGIYAAIVGGGIAIGTFANNWLVVNLSWRGCLYAGVPLAVIAAIGAAALVRDTQVRTPARPDVPGVLLGSVGLAALVYGFHQAESRGWADFLVVVLLVGGLGMLVLFAWSQTRTTRTTSPLLPRYVFEDRNRVGSCLALTFISSGVLIQYLVLTLYLQGARGYAPSQTGVALLPMAGAVAIASTQVSARLYRRLAPRSIIVPGLVLTAIGLALLTGIDTDSAYATQVLPGTLLIGFGLGLAFVPLFATATGGICPQDSGGTSAMVNAAQQSGNWAASPLFGSILTSAVAARLHHTSGAPEGLNKAAEQGVLLGQQNLPAALSDTVREMDRAVLGGYSVALWWAVGLTLLAGLLAGLLVTAKAPTDGAGPR